MKKSTVVSVILGIVLVGVGLYFFLPQKVGNLVWNEISPYKAGITMEEKEVMDKSMESDPASDETVIKMDETEMMEKMESMKFMFFGELADVTSESISDQLLGLDTLQKATGTAKFVYDSQDSLYLLEATFTDLPPAPKGTFYEGWIVRISPFNFISTGEAEMIDGQYRNIYSSETDYSDHLLYVLTIEPDDNDPAPAAHVLEGKMDIPIN